MKRFLVFAIIILGILFLFFALVFFFKEPPASPRIPTNTPETPGQGEQKDQITPILVFSGDTPLNSSWQKDSFFVYIEETDFGGPNDQGAGSTEDLLACRYSVNGQERSRTCNTPLFITVGPDSSNDCSVQGTNVPAEGLKFTCALTGHAIDHTGNETDPASRPSRLYGIDWTPPFVSKVFVNTLGETEPIAVPTGSVTYRVETNEEQDQTVACTRVHKRPADSLFTAGPSVSSGLPCGRACDLSVDHALPGPGDWQVRMVCLDSASNVNAWKDTQTSIRVETLSVTLSADPASGSINTLFDVSSQVLGAATGDVNFKFDCTNDGTWEYERDSIDLSVSDPGWVTRSGDGTTQTKVTAPDTFAVQDLCQYSSPATYTAATLIERSISAATDTVFIAVVANTPPQATSLNDNNDTVDYCFVSVPPITLSWTFSDPDPGDEQTAYQLQVDTNPGFSSPDDTGKQPSSSTQYSPLNLSYNTTYHWRVKVWDFFDDQSVPEWATGIPFTTPVHIYPFSDFTWIPGFPSAEEEIQFIDQTTFASESSGRSWSWDFGDTGTSSQQNPMHLYQENGAYTVNLTVGDDAGFCVAQNTVNITLPFPEWQEISPF